MPLVTDRTVPESMLRAESLRDGSRGAGRGAHGLEPESLLPDEGDAASITERSPLSLGVSKTIQEELQFQAARQVLRSLPCLPLPNCRSASLPQHRLRARGLEQRLDRRPRAAATKPPAIGARQIELPGLPAETLARTSASIERPSAA